MRQVDEMTIVSIIASAGEANSLMQQAFMAIKDNNLEECENYLKQADEALVKAHQVQTDLIQSEAKGEKTEVTLLMVHAQDHLMNVILTKQIIGNMIEMQKEINQLKGGMKND